MPEINDGTDGDPTLLQVRDLRVYVIGVARVLANGVTGNETAPVPCRRLPEVWSVAMVATTTGSV